MMTTTTTMMSRMTTPERMTIRRAEEADDDDNVEDAVANATPRVLLVNPWIHDFAAYDFWGGRWLVHGRRSVARGGRGGGPAGPDRSLFALFAGRVAAAAQAHRTRSFPASVYSPAGGSALYQSALSALRLPPELAARHCATDPVRRRILVTSMMTYWYTGYVKPSLC
jgi:hypothetical protein